MTATNTSATAAHSTGVSTQAGSIILLASVIAFVRAALVVLAAASLGAMAKAFFPEMFVLPASPVALIAVVAVDTFVLAAGVLMARAKSSVPQGH